MAGQEIAPKADKDLSQEQLMKQIDQARVELGRTVDAIADKVKPANVAKRTLEQVRQRVATVDPKLAGAGAAAAVGLATLDGVLRGLRRRRTPGTQTMMGRSPPGARPIVGHEISSHGPWSVPR